MHGNPGKRVSKSFRKSLHFKVKKSKIMEKIIIRISLTLYLSSLLIGSLLIGTLFTESRGSTRLTDISPIAGYISPRQHEIDVLEYRIAISLLTATKSIEGTTEIIIVRLSDTLTGIDLNFSSRLSISSFSINGFEASYNNRGSRLTFAVPQSDTFSVKVIYSGTPEKKGFGSFVFGKYNGYDIVHTMNEPEYASTWFPCNDRPDDKAFLKLSITNDSSMVSVANGILDTVYLSGGNRTYCYKTLYPISTYLTAFYSAQYSVLSDNYTASDGSLMPLEYYVLPGYEEKAKIDFATQPKIIGVLSELFGEYPFIREKYGIAQFLWMSGAMEHQTITGVAVPMVTGTNRFEDVLVHELAHHWWGNSVGPASWKDIWLNEGFATYSEALYYEKVRGEDAYQRIMQESFDLYESDRLYNPENGLFSQLVYHKGAWVLAMLRYEVGDSLFFRLLKEYYLNFQYSNASTQQFQQLAEKITGKNLHKFFDQWVYSGVGIPELEFYVTEDKEGFLLQIEQVQKGYDQYTFSIPVLITDTKGIEHSYLVPVQEKVTKFQLSGVTSVESIELDPDSKLLISSIQKEL